jgi:hypothetical protein
MKDLIHYGFPIFFYYVYMYFMLDTDLARLFLNRMSNLIFLFLFMVFCDSYKFINIFNSAESIRFYIFIGVFQAIYVTTSCLYYHFTEVKDMSKINEKRNLPKFLVNTVVTPILNDFLFLLAIIILTNKTSYIDYFIDDLDTRNPFIYSPKFKSMLIMIPLVIFYGITNIAYPNLNIYKDQ